jgi:hypothetical protein
MPQLYPYQVFISHAWDYKGDYYRMEQLLDGHPNFDWRNFSVPKHDPFHRAENLAEGLREQIRRSHVIIALAGMYAAHSDWIQFEIDFAKSLKKPIIGVYPWGQERAPEAITKAATVMHGWNVGPIVSSIRELAA